MTNKYPDNYNLMDHWVKSQYDWKFGQSLGTDTSGNEWFIVEDEPDSTNFYWCLVSISPEGALYQHKTQTVPKETYVTERALEAMDQLAADFYDFYND